MSDEKLVEGGPELPRLLDCPFCGEPPYVAGSDEAKGDVWCADALCPGAHATPIEAWNRRADRRAGAPRDSGTYGELPATIRAMLPGHEWDNMTREEQRTWLIEKLAGRAGAGSPEPSDVAIDAAEAEAASYVCSVADIPRGMIVAALRAAYAVDFPAASLGRPAVSGAPEGPRTTAGIPDGVKGQLVTLAMIVGSDNIAATFQTLGQYRTMLIGCIDDVLRTVDAAATPRDNAVNDAGVAPLGEGERERLAKVVREIWEVPYSDSELPESLSADCREYLPELSDDDVRLIATRLLASGVRLGTGTEGIPEALADDLPYPEDRGSTHWEHCWATRGHHNCAVFKLRELLACAPPSGETPHA